MLLHTGERVRHPHANVPPSTSRQRPVRLVTASSVSPASAGDVDQRLAALRCPYCRGTLEVHDVPTPAEGRGRWGLLRCSCREHPLIDDIVILNDGSLGHMSEADAGVVLPGPSVADVVARLREGRTSTVLSTLLVRPPAPHRLSGRRIPRWVATASPIAREMARLRRPLIGAVLRRRRDTMTAERWLHLTYRRTALPGDLYNHFFMRFGQPRMLAALALLEGMPDGPIVDLCSGYGHLLHTLGTTRPAIAVDQSFLSLWVSRWYVAPHALHVCADANRTLPLRDGAATSAVCSDAFCYLSDLPARAAELVRVAGGGPVVLARLGNVAHAPHEGTEHTVEGWRGMLSALGPVRMWTEDELQATYLSNRTADPTIDGPDLEGGKWLCAAIGDGLAAEAALSDPAPHHRGRLVRNPLYVSDGDDERFAFPSEWYAAENGSLTDLLPGRVDPHHRTPSGPGDLTIVGVPDRYC
ncbi:Methyltransferase type 11 [Euzebya pacifica]|uniref:Methyltransferase type 11 n=1 Tax=Euzebya pacifica TaxID=1608957 RepID=A0A346XZQ8_9ACTN|nr:Methyltransferase type 11 [Euzebya pacifica]